MIINDLSHVETLTEDNNIQGGLAISDAFSGAFASGGIFAGTLTSTVTASYSNNFVFGPLNLAISTSKSQSAAS